MDKTDRNKTRQKRDKESQSRQNRTEKESVEVRVLCCMGEREVRPRLCQPSPIQTMPKPRPRSNPDVDTLHPAQKSLQTVDVGEPWSLQGTPHMKLIREPMPAY